MIRLLLEVPAPAPDTLTVRGERLHYLAHVLRLREGAALEVFDGRGARFAATVVSLGEDAATLSLSAPQPGVFGSALTLLQGLPKADKLEWIIQKGTELGVSRFMPVATARAVVKLDAERGAHKRERWQKIADEAARQCGRSDTAAVEAPQPLLQAAAALPEGTQLLILDEEERTLRLSAAVRRDPGPVALVIGPEGGLSREEVAALQGRGGIPVTLGPRVLRTETAGIAAASVLLHLHGELG